MKRFLLTFIISYNLGLAAYAEANSAEEMVDRIKDAEIASQTWSLPLDFDLVVVCSNHRTYQFDNFVSDVFNIGSEFSSAKIIKGNDFSEDDLPNLGKVLYVYIGDENPIPSNRQECLHDFPKTSAVLQDTDNWIEKNGNVSSKLKQARTSEPLTHHAQTDIAFGIDTNSNRQVILTLITTMNADDKIVKLLEDALWSWSDIAPTLSIQ